MKYNDLEDYKRQGYGIEGRSSAEPGHDAASSTDAPTLSGVNDLSSERDFSATDTINRQGGPLNCIIMLIKVLIQEEFGE
ncbi:Late embryogenesis abundant protein, LEA-18 [Corchorus olitorius]|uniref:Late embryogenesis abundant protein, LEA-18 n=1 Tax=Corchorus olitorius TaxID=93759 RepID=A0A1R3KBG1_9ROSI|nr:Late embryogenesis abundant protein, LEA-18 [Corchorus olitorius]